jgi:Uri superfamily endonuclease
MMTPQPGTYALILASTKTAPIRVGKLGSLQLQPGFYVYTGSAHGPGGLRARLAHHLKPTARPHWHIDYLRANTNPEEVWYCCGLGLWEHRWAQCLGLQQGASVPLTGFGSSDCRCETHLYFFGSRPSRAAFARSLRTIDRRHPPVRQYRTAKPCRLPSLL